MVPYNPHIKYFEGNRRRSLHGNSDLDTDVAGCALHDQYGTAGRYGIH
jgi:hypothetical protein